MRSANLLVSLWYFTRKLFASISVGRDWLVDRIPQEVTYTKSYEFSRNANNLEAWELTNGLVSLVFAVTPDFARLGFQSHLDYLLEIPENDENISDRKAPRNNLLRSINPEANIVIDDIDYSVGGLDGQTVFAFFNMSNLSNLRKRNESDVSRLMSLVDVKTENTQAPYEWKNGKRFADPKLSWPPRGLSVVATFRFPVESTDKKYLTVPISHRNLSVSIHYEMYEGIPLIAKWISIHNSNNQKITINKMEVERLALNQPYTPLTFEPYPPSMYIKNSGSLHIETSWFHSCNVTWVDDPLVKLTPGASMPLLIVNYNGSLELDLVNGSFDSFRTFELVYEMKADRERKSLAIRHMIRTIAPQISENPIYMQLDSFTIQNFKKLVDQISIVEFEMIIFSFGSGFCMECSDVSYRKAIADLVSYAHIRGIEVGAYDEIGYGRWDGITNSSQIDPVTGLESSMNTCFASDGWSGISQAILEMVDSVALDHVELDGPYPGYECASKQHAHHKGLKDSIFKQEYQQILLLSELRKRSIFITVPDHYYFVGTNKYPFKYHENQFSLPRMFQLHLSRQGLYDSLYSMPTTLGWGFVPLSHYKSSSKDAIFEPTSEHLKEYSWALQQYIGLGLTSCWRGDRLYDNESDKIIVLRWVQFFKQYRSLLTGSIIHIKRPDMQGIDAMMNVNPSLHFKAHVAIFNPTESIINETLLIPMHYTGMHSPLIDVWGFTGEEYEITGNDPSFMLTVQMNELDVSIQISIHMKPMSILHLFLSRSNATHSGCRIVCNRHVNEVLKPS